MPGRWLLVPALLAATLLLPVVGLARSGLLVVATFPPLAADIAFLACPGDRVVSLLPPGVEPHDYQLRPADVELLSRADVIVSTGHTVFEREIERLVEEGRLHAVVVNVLELPGIHVRVNPSTGQPDYHMVVYDPDNYLVMMRAVAEAMARLNPGCAGVYASRLHEIEQVVSSLKRMAPSTPRIAVADKPYTVYAVSWLGLRVVHVLELEHGVPVPPESVERAEKLLARGAVAVVTDPPVAASSRLLLDLARRHGAPVLLVHAPTGRGPVLSWLQDLLSQVRRLGLEQQVHEHRTGQGLRVEARWLLAIASASLAAGALSPLIAARRLYFLAGSLPHTALLAVALAIPLTGADNPYLVLVAIAVSVALIYAFEALQAAGVDPDTAASVFLAFTASACVIAVYYVLTQYRLEASLWAYILGDPLLASWGDVAATALVSGVVVVASLATYRRQVLIAVSRETARLAGVRVWAYDALLLAMLAAATVGMLRTLGFVLEHVLLLLPGVVAATLCEQARTCLAVSLAVSLAAGVAGLLLALVLDTAPAGTIGLLMLAAYTVALAARRSRG